jgi:hypothetical protein
MKRAGAKLVTGAVERDDAAAMADALAKLLRANASAAGDIVERLSPMERARLAVFCYGRNHLNAVGLAIAAQCGLDHLIAASRSATAGRALHAQSRDVPVARPPQARRAAITLASSVSHALASRAAVPAELPA